MKRAAAILLAILLTACVPLAHARGTRTQIGTDVSGFSAVTLTGESIDGSVFTEYDVSVVMYWATWLPVPEQQLSILQQVHDAHPEYGVFGLLHTDATSTAEAAAALMAANGFDFTVFICEGLWQDIVNETMMIPQSFIVDADGILVESWQATFDSADTMESRLFFWSGAEPTPEPTEEPTPEPTPGPTDDPNPGPTEDPTPEPTPGQTEDPTPEPTPGQTEAPTRADALYILRCAMGLIEPGEENIAHGDMDGNGALSSGDALAVLRMCML